MRGAARLTTALLLIGIVAAVVTRSASADNLTPILRLTGHTTEVYSVVFSPDGQTLASASNRELKVWDVNTAKERFTWPIKGTNVYGLAFSPDGLRLAIAISKQVHILDARTGTEALAYPAASQFVFRLGFSPDGKHLTAASGSNGNNIPGEVCIWEADTGKSVCCLRGHTEPVLNIAYSHDARILASASGAASGSRAGEIKLWDAEAGRELQSFRGHPDNIYGLAFSADGRRIVSGSGVRGATQAGTVKVWEVLTGQEVMSDSSHAGPVFGVTFSPSGRWFATAGGDGTVRLRDTASGAERLQLAAHVGAVYSLALTADGQRLASAGQDNVVNVWGLTGRVPHRETPATPPTQRELEALWADLSSGNAAQASRSLWKMVDAPSQSVPFLRARIAPVTGITPSQCEQAAAWIRDLDDKRFKVRERAAQELSRLEEAALPLLRQALADGLAPEARRRAEQLVAVLSDPALAGERLAARRGIEVLEHCGTLEAAAVLQRLAAGLPEARLTRDAQASLARLARHAAR